MNNQISLDTYFRGLDVFFNALLNFSFYYYNEHSPPRELFPDILEPYSYSMLLIFSTIILSTFIGLVISAAFSEIPKKWSKQLSALFFLSESIPDIFVAVSAQALVIWYFQKTDVLLFNLASSYEEQAFFIPLITLCILPTLFITRLLLVRMEEEKNEPYYTMAIAKGISRPKIMMYHLLPNTLISLIAQVKYLLWYILSNLVMIEYIFNLNGMTSFIIRFNNPEVFIVSTMLIFIPLNLFSQSLQFMCYRWIGVRTE